MDIDGKGQPSSTWKLDVYTSSTTGNNPALTVTQILTCMNLYAYREFTYFVRSSDNYNNAAIATNFGDFQKYVITATQGSIEN